MRTKIEKVFLNLASLSPIDLIFFALIFLSLQFWWIRMTIKNGRTGEVDKWGQKTNPKKLNELEKAKQDLEKLFRS